MIAKLHFSYFFHECSSLLAYCMRACGLNGWWSLILLWAQGPHDTRAKRSFWPNNKQICFSKYNPEIINLSLMYQYSFTYILWVELLWDLLYFFLLLIFMEPIVGYSLDKSQNMVHIGRLTSCFTWDSTCLVLFKSHRKLVMIWVANNDFTFWTLTVQVVTSMASHSSRMPKEQWSLGSFCPLSGSPHLHR